MSQDFQDDLLPWLKNVYFSDPKQRLSLKKGEILIDQGEENDRLFLVLDGELAGKVSRPDGGSYDLFNASKNMFVGVYSFFSRTFISSAQVRAVEPCKIAYIDQNQDAVDDDGGVTSLFEQFMPVVVANLLTRMQKEQEIAFEKEQTLKRLFETEKLAVLGQMAAGITHELNNAISVLSKNTEWLKERLQEFYELYKPATYPFFQKGLEEGRRLSSREVREKAKQYQVDLGLDIGAAAKLAQTGIPDDMASNFEQIDAEISEVFADWEIGAVFHDMNVAANMATHVVRSVKALAVQTSGKEQDVNINDTIHEAIVLLISPLRKVEVELELHALPNILGSRGEWVQVWTNLIRNAAEALLQSAQDDKLISINSNRDNHYITVKIIDNGPGIPKEALSKIMQPDFTTKEKGLEFGLGLGLAITSKILGKYDGDIKIKSVSGRTEFMITIPFTGL